MSVYKKEVRLRFTTWIVVQLKQAIVFVAAIARPAITLLVSACFTAMTLIGAVAQTVATAGLLIATTLVVTPAFSQSTISTTNAADANPPSIELERIPSGVAGQEQVFTSLVSDDGGIKEVKLFYRYKGQAAFTSLPMEPLGNSAYYAASVRPTETETRAIEYYVQAIDTAGNRQIEGFAFEPITRELTRPEVPATTSTSTAETSTASKSGGLKFWQIILGVLAVGAIAGAAAGGGGGNDSSPGQTVPLTLTVTSP